ncbi:MAG: LamG-like jellyroll fold domain-containing protein [Patescibacteria group bacterium]
MRIIKLSAKIFVFIWLSAAPVFCRAMPPGTLLYRTSGDGKMYGYSDDPLIYDEGGIIKNIYAGHAAIYIGKENGEDYIVEAMPDGIVKTPAKYFVNRAENETFLGARIPSAATPLQQAKAVTIAKSLVGKKLDYDFDFKYQKGPISGRWTCVGLTEKLYESADIANPNNLASLEYDPSYYAVDITPDGFDNYSTVNKEGDCFSREREFSKIARRPDLLIPAPELIGFDVGLENNGERYIFLPYTQFLQPSLKAVTADVAVASYFSGAETRAPLNVKALVLRWSLINNPVSALKNLAGEVKNFVVKAAVKTGELAKSLGAKIFGSDSGTEIVLEDGGTEKAVSKTASKKTAAQKTNSAVVKANPKVTVNKATTVNSGNKAKTTSAATSKTAVASAQETTGKIGSKTVAKATKTNTVKTVAKTAVASTTAITAYYDSATVQPIVVSANNSGGSSGGSSSPSASSVPKLAIINKIYSTGNDDWIELFNPGDEDFDLATAGYRLERAKTAEDPALIMRLGNTEDGSYPGGTIIKAHDSYLIVRATAGDYYRNQADALATRDEFSWTGSGYTLYLGINAISSSADPDIIDAVGYGPDATYFQGSGPAPEISDNYILNRVADNNDNSTDFNLLLSPNAEITTIIEETATSTEDVATSTENIATTTEDIIQDTATTTEEMATTTEDIATTTEDVTTSTPPVDDTTEDEPKIALINRIYSTGDNDWVELFNPGDKDFDLAATGYRLEKTKTADDPSLIMRLGNTEDGSYPGGTIIKAYDSYLIARDDANDYNKSQADAIATRDEFSWTGSDYTLYLGTGAISSSLDSDIVDAVGYGPEATYFLGSGPAPEISDNYILSRVADNDDNATDFRLVLSADPSIVLEPPTDSDSDFGLFVAPTPIDSAGLTNVWHFDECHGEGERAIGKWECARVVGFNYPGFKLSPGAALNLEQLSFSFYYKRSHDFPRLILELSDSAGDNKMSLSLEPGLATVEGLPNSAWRYYTDIPFDDSWHQATLVVNQEEDYWAVYIDGRETIKENFMARLFAVTELTISGNCDPVLIDELAVWNRSLAAAEILAAYRADAPFNPLTAREPQKPAVLDYLWNFEEDTGSVATDSVNGLILNVPSESWVGRSHNNYAIGTSFGSTFSAEFVDPLDSEDLSLTLWWRDRDRPNQGRANIYLIGGADKGTNIFSLLANNYRLGFWSDGNYGILAEGLNTAIPDDGAWHHLALVYDSYRYKLSFYVDGEEKAGLSLIRMREEREINYLKISTDGSSSEIDELGVWSGALSPTQIKDIYANNK